MSDAQSQIRYRVLEPDVYSPDANHTQIGDDVYLAPEQNGLETADAQGAVEVLDWNYDGEDVTLNGPAEPIVTDEGIVKVLCPAPNRPGDVDAYPLGVLECQRCGTEAGQPLQRGESFEPPHECPGCERQGPFQPPWTDETDTAIETLADPFWYPPSGISDERYGELWADVNDYIYDHWDAREDEIYAGLTAYAISTWLRPNLTFVPHLLLMGKFTGGKTRLLNTLARVSYRAVVTASATPASMFRMIDAHDVSYYVSEYHGLIYETRQELDAVVRAGQKRGEIVTRAESTSNGYEPKVFDPFTHVSIATQYEPPDDIISRCIQVRSSPAERDMPATHDEDRATDIRNRMLYARYRLLESDEWERAETEAYEYLAEKGIDGRSREKLLSIVTVAILWDRVNDVEPFVERVVADDEQALADSEDAQFVAVVRDLALDKVGEVSTLDDGDPFGAVEIPLATVADQYNEATGEDKSTTWAGQIRSRLGLDKARKRDGTVIKDPDLGPKLRRLCKENNLEWERAEHHEPVKELDDDKKDRGRCSLCGNSAFLTHKDAEEGHWMCDSCAEECLE